MKRYQYTFIFTLSGKDVNGKNITPGNTFRQDVTATTQEKAEKKLRSFYFKSVTIEIKAVTTTAV